MGGEGAHVDDGSAAPRHHPRHHGPVRCTVFSVRWIVYTVTYQYLYLYLYLYSVQYQYLDTDSIELILQSTRAWRRASPSST